MARLRTVGCLRPPVEALDHALGDVVGHGRHHLVLVVEGQVVDDVLAVEPHAAQAVADDGGHLVGEGRVVGLGDGVHRRQQEAVAVLVLEALAEQRGAPGGGAEQEARGPASVACQMRSPTRWKPNIE